jgi:hypothetical protein
VTGYGDIASEAHADTGPGMPVLRGTRLPLGEQLDEEIHLAPEHTYRRHDYTYGASLKRWALPDVEEAYAFNNNPTAPDDDGSVNCVKRKRAAMNKAARRKRILAARARRAEERTATEAFTEPVRPYPVSEPQIPAHVVAQHRREHDAMRPKRLVSRNRDMSTGTMLGDLLNSLADQS